MLGIESRPLKVAKIVVGDELVRYGRVTHVGPCRDRWLPANYVRIYYAGVKGYMTTGHKDFDPTDSLDAYLDNNDRR